MQQLQGSPIDVSNLCILRHQDNAISRGLQNRLHPTFAGTTLLVEGGSGKRCDPLLQYGLQEGGYIALIRFAVSDHQGNNAPDAAIRQDDGYVSHRGLGILRSDRVQDG